MYQFSEDLQKWLKKHLPLGMKNIFFVSILFCGRWKAGEDNQWHQDILNMLFYVLLKSYV